MVSVSVLVIRNNILLADIDVNSLLPIININNNFFTLTPILFCADRYTKVRFQSVGGIFTKTYQHFTIEYKLSNDYRQ